MLAMQEDTRDRKLYTPAEAIEYLRERRGLIFTVGGLRVRRNRGRATADRVLGRISLWTKAELDAIEPTGRTRRVNPSITDEKKDFPLLLDIQGELDALNNSD